MKHIEGRAARARDRIEQQSEQLIDSVQHLASLALEDTGHLLKRARRKGASWLDDGRDDLRRRVDQAEELVLERPIRSVLIAAGVGLLIGLACRR